MKTTKQPWTRAAKALGAASLILTVTLLATWRGWSNPPALNIAATGTNEVTLTVINPVTNAVYEIWWTEFLDADAVNGLWTGAWQPLYPPGTNNQTVFAYSVWDLETGYFRAINTLDIDNDGVPNYQDSRPFDASFGILRVTIESPANGSNVQ